MKSILPILSIAMSGCITMPDMNVGDSPQPFIACANISVPLSGTALIVKIYGVQPGSSVVVDGDTCSVMIGK